jgi:hypothetical protein
MDIATGATVGNSDWLIWFVLFIWFVWFTQINKTNQTDQMNKTGWQTVSAFCKA